MTDELVRRAEAEIAAIRARIADLEERAAALLAEPPSTQEGHVSRRGHFVVIEDPRSEAQRRESDDMNARIRAGAKRGSVEIPADALLDPRVRTGADMNALIRQKAAQRTSRAPQGAEGKETP